MSACATCGCGLNARNRSGYCRAHYGKVHGAANGSASLRARWSDPAKRPALLSQARQAQRSRLADIPLAYQDDYRVLTRKLKTPAAEARREIANRVKQDTEAYVAKCREVEQRY